MKFLYSEVALYLYKFTIWPCMEYCGHVWTGAPSCYLELLDQLQKQICRTSGSSFAVSLEPQAHHQNVAILSFGRCSPELAQLVPLLEGGLLVILIDCMIFLSPFLAVTRMSYVNCFFPRITKMQNSLPIECFPLTYDLFWL